MNLENSDLSSPPLPSESNIDAAVRTVGHRTLSCFAYDGVDRSSASSTVARMDAAPGVVIVDGRGRFMTPAGCSTNNSTILAKG
jgi:hypothetical protein